MCQISSEDGEDEDAEHENVSNHSRVCTSNNIKESTAHRTVILPPTNVHTSSTAAVNKSRGCSADTRDRMAENEGPDYLSIPDAKHKIMVKENYPLVTTVENRHDAKSCNRMLTSKLSVNSEINDIANVSYKVEIHEFPLKHRDDGDKLSADKLHEISFPVNTIKRVSHSKDTVVPQLPDEEKFEKLQANEEHTLNYKLDEADVVSTAGVVSMVDLKYKFIKDDTNSSLRKPKHERKPRFSPKGGLLFKKDKATFKLVIYGDFVKELRKRLWLSPATFRMRPTTLIVAPVFEEMKNVIDKISEGERVPPNVSMRYEMLRLCSFRTYPEEDKPFLIRFAQAGFYYASNGDEVVCFCCAKRISNWKAEDNPMEIHRRVSPSCSFLINNSEVNVPVTAGPEGASADNETRRESTSSHTDSLFSQESPTDELVVVGASSNTITRGKTSQKGGDAASRNLVRGVADMSLSNRDDIQHRRNGLMSLPNSFDQEKSKHQTVLIHRESRQTETNSVGDQRQLERSHNNTAGSLMSSGRPEHAVVQAVQQKDDTMRYTSLPPSVNGQRSYIDQQNHVSSQSTGCGVTNQESQQRHKRTTTTGAQVVSNQSQQESQQRPNRTTSAGTPVVSNQSQQGGSINPMPKHPKYASEMTRFTSFNTCTSIAVTPKRLSEAGFFYAGTADCTRCFQCAIGLRHWSQDDDPWVEHARFSIDCCFVRRKKGEEFIHLIRLALAYSENTPGPVSPPTPTTGSISASNGSELNTLLRNSAAQSVIEIGYHADIVEKAISVVVRQKGQTGITAANIIDQIFVFEDTGEIPRTGTCEATPVVHNTTENCLSKSSTESSDHARNNTTVDPSDAPTDNTVATSTQASMKGNKSSRNGSNNTQMSERRKLKKENKLLKMMTYCSSCKTKEVCIVFLPCGHLVTCEDCAPSIRKCLICSQVVKGTVRTYRS